MKSFLLKENKEVGLVLYVSVCGNVYVEIKICSSQGMFSPWPVSMLMAMGNDLLKRDHI